MAIPFTQYMLPNGTPKRIEIDRPPGIEAKADSILATGKYRFEAEVLTTGEVSLTTFNLETEENDAIEVCTNSPKVLDAVDKMISNFPLTAKA